MIENQFWILYPIEITLSTWPQEHLRRGLMAQASYTRLSPARLSLLGVPTKCFSWL